MSFGLLLFVVGTLALATQTAHALPNDEHPPQREWVYDDFADAVTGDIYPGAFLMSRKGIDGSAKSPGLGHGYLAVGNSSIRPMEVGLSWDEPASRSDVFCKPIGCEVAVRFGAAAPIKFVAVWDKPFRALILKDGRVFIAAATRHVGEIEVQVQTLAYGLVTRQFSVASRLQVEKLAKPKR
jgi:hypothetical protein